MQIDYERIKKTMHKKMVAVAICIAAFAASAVAQTVTGSGTTSTVPVFTGTSTVGNSPISVSGSNVGIGTTGPGDQLDIYDGSGAAIQASNAKLRFSDISGTMFLRMDNSGNLEMTDGSTNPRVHFANGGDVGIGTTTPSVPLEISTITAGNPAVLKVVRTGGNVGGEGPSLEFDDFLNSGPQGHIYTSLYNFPSAANAVGKLILGSHGNAAATSSSFNDELTLFNGNVGIGMANPSARLEVSGSVKLTANSGGSITFQDGTTQTTAFIPSTSCGADYAESVDVSGDRTKYAPGDILVIDPNAPGKFLKSNQAYSTLVAGVYSTKPGYIGRLHPEDAKTDKTEVPMAMVGRVPTKVTAENGPIMVGDLLVASSKMGYAMKGTDRSQMLGAVIGKALGSLDSGTGVIEVLVTLQ